MYRIKLSPAARSKWQTGNSLHNVPERHASSLFGSDPVRRDMQKRQMSGAGVFHSTVRPRPANNQRSELSGCGALAKQPIGVRDHRLQRKILPNERAKRGMQVAHQHRRGYAFARNVAQQKEKRAI